MTDVHVCPRCGGPKSHRSNICRACANGRGRPITTGAGLTEQRLDAAGKRTVRGKQKLASTRRNDWKYRRTCPGCGGLMYYRSTRCHACVRASAPI